MRRNPAARVLTLVIIAALASGVSFAQSRISFKRGRSSATVSGRLAAYTARTYIVRAKEGQTLRLTIKGDVSSEVLPDAAVPSMSGSADYSDYNLTKTGDYVIQLTAGEKATSFTMTVSILDLN